MSLVGLDAPEVVEAHQASIADPTGWLLIKYQDGSRDHVQLLQSGTGGINEARKAIEAYAEKSPLYGLVPFRRRRVLIKYVPEGTSRVFQVRLKVQFQSVVDALSPYDNVFEFSQASELTESALTAATMLAPSNGSVSSHSSRHKKRLNHIAEYAPQYPSRPGTAESGALAINKEEIPSFPRPPSSNKRDAESENASQFPAPAPAARVGLAKTRADTGELPASALRAKALMAKRKEMGSLAAASTLPPPSTGPPITATKQKAVAPEPVRRDQASLDSVDPVRDMWQPTPTFGLEKSLPAIPIDTVPSTTEGFEKITEEYLAEPESQPEIAADIGTHLSLTAEHLEQTRQPSGADQKTISQWNDDVALYASIVRPKKKKLGPRPHVETNIRPGTADQADKSLHARPVSNLPASVKITNNRVQAAPLIRPKSQQSSKSLPARTYQASSRNGTLPPLPSPVYGASVYRPENRALPSRAGSATNEALSNATPEKLRLMKALQIRKRNMLLSQRASHFAQESPGVPVPDGHSAASSHSDTIQQSAELTNIKSASDDGESTDRAEVRQASETASPSSMTYPSEAHSTQASSRTSHEEAPPDHHSLSSDLSSSVIPMCQPLDIKKTAPSENQIEVEQTRPTEEAKLDSSSTVDAVPSDKNITSDESYPAIHLEANEQPEVIADSADSSEQIDKLPWLEEEPTKAPSSRTATPSVLDNSKKEQSQNGANLAPPLVSPAAEQFEISDSDSLMDALQNAVVEEAMSMPVARSPATPVMHTQSFKETNRSHSHSLSRPSEASKSSASLVREKPVGSRSVSTPLPQWPRPNPEPVPLTNKSSLGTGISKRIKALEVVSSRQSSPPREPAPAPRPVFSLFPKHSPQATQLQQRTVDTGGGRSPARKVNYSPSAEKRQPPPQMWRQRQDGGGVLAPPPKGETVSVTARIVRDHLDGESGQSTDLLDFMHQSPLIVEHDKPAALFETTPVSGEVIRKGRPSMSSNASHPLVGVSSADSTASKWPFGKSRHRMSRTASDNSSVAEDQPRSRKGRLIKRLTNLAGGRPGARDLVAHGELEPPEAIEEEERVSRVSTSESLQHVVDIGDVNVQFPDSLLWKRRFIRIDDQGSLIFSPLNNDANTRSTSRRYHLSEVRTPTLPDCEREQVAHSIMIDFKDGNCIHCACESKEMQQQVLQSKDNPLIDGHD
ncbi:hypothetical protein DV735_g5324, partial [Chaetothyriales sp. CBS 134920]